MALRGNLRDFSLPDVFQLVTFSRKTGVLRIQREDDAHGSVWFRDGDVFFAQSNWHTEPLGERLVKAQRITPQALKRALELRAGEPEDGRRLGRILTDEGYITEKVLEAFVSEQIQDTIFDLMRWDEGEFDFEAMPEVVDEDIGLSVSIENVVMEGARRLEEWTRIKKKIPSMDVVFKMATAPGEGTFEISLKPIEWQLLLLVDGTRSVAELAVATNRTDFEVARIVYGLFSAGLLEFASEEEIEHNRAERAEREAKQAKLEEARKAEEQEQQRAALEREAKLAEEAAARRASQPEPTPLPVDEPAAAETITGPAVPESTEVPEFLGGTSAAPTAEDEAVLEQFMGAVLEQPASPRTLEPELEPVPTAPAAAYVPGEEPPFVALSHDEESDDLILAVPSVEDLLGITAAPAAPVEVPEAPTVEAEQELEAVHEPEPAIEPEPEPEAAEPALEEPAPYAFESEPTAGTEEYAEQPDEFARDLMALGLGELPSDLLSPIEEESSPAEPAGWGAPPIEVEPLAPVVDRVVEPMSETEADGGAEDFTAEVAPSTDAPLDELAALSASLELPREVPTDVPELTAEEEEAPDFSALLDSLDVDADLGAESGAEVEASPADAGFDTDLLFDEAPAPTGGVISTDAFLEDISIEDIGFSGSLNDELSALTGAERRTPQRPQASVNAIPEAGAGTLHRDTRVDKETLLKIIDGIKNL